MDKRKQKFDSCALCNPSCDIMECLSCESYQERAFTEQIIESTDEYIELLAFNPFNRQEIIKYMRDENTEEWYINLHCPNLFKYNASLLTNESKYYIDCVNKEIILVIE